jgi:hypothetical protein
LDSRSIWRKAISPFKIDRKTGIEAGTNNIRRTIQIKFLFTKSIIKITTAKVPFSLMKIKEKQREIK